ncbi:DUF3253 domain-containing protein [Ancylobacter oerskovii]|uniref:DUF3253 domain-containing protein n=1 Tax=Ancylobacter oerskovii TaxID=459519 RepID=A0ABW4Z1P7_9HYPH|nr:DUF3253 domain-containing protein [Ancylobacter oerskovii]MBS7544988.1 DUF3253 domain-containing protein [Ancylobacter oerskovii]
MTESASHPALPSDSDVEAAIRAALAGASRTIGPETPARALMPEGKWQAVLPLVKRVAVRLALDGTLGIYRKGKLVDPSDFRGVYRLGPPAHAAPAAD